RTDNGVTKALLNTGRRIDDHKVKFPAELLAELLHLYAGDSVFIACLGSRQQVEFGQTLIFDESLAQTALPFNNINKVIDDAIFQTHDGIEVTQADIRVHNGDFFPLHGESGTK